MGEDTLTTEDQALIETRHRALRAWPAALTVSLLLWVAFALWAVMRLPHLTNPLVVIDEVGLIRQPIGDLGALATLTPFLFWALWFVVLLFIGFTVVWVKNEKRLLAIIDHLRK